MASTDYHRQLNDWHLQLGMCGEALKFTIDQIQDIDDGLLSTLGILEDRLLHLVETCPFPVQSAQDEQATIQ